MPSVMHLLIFQFVLQNSICFLKKKHTYFSPDTYEEFMDVFLNTSPAKIDRGNVVLPPPTMGS